LFDARALGHSREFLAKLAVVVMNEIFWPAVPRGGLFQLLGCPFIARASSHSYMYNPSGLMLHEYEDVEWLE
jgi:hypothetical protein